VTTVAEILIIDDDHALRAVMRRILQREGHTVRDAEDGERGLREVNANLPDIVITDLIMPEKEGIETIQALRSDFPELKILAISGAGSSEEGGPLMDAELLGADSSLPKPFTPAELVGAVSALLAR
jgi:DNA-binding response OmpR family regulator